MLIKWMNRQNVIAHMTLWGLFSGALLGAGYALLLMFMNVFPEPGFDSDLLEIVMQVLMMIFYGACFGGGAGLPMGLINGLLMGLVKQSRHLTLTRKKHISYGINLLVVLVVVFFLSDGLRYIDWFLIGAPALIASGASLLATDRHFAHLNPRKSKAKRIPTAG
jgi:hypothetical protein